MRGFLLWLASMIVGSATCLVAVSVLSDPGPGPVLGGLAIWLFAVVVGGVVSAPYFLNPPPGGGGWSVRLPWPLMVMLFVMLFVGWVGRNVLLGAWLLLFQLRPAMRPGAPAPFTSPASPARAAMPAPMPAIPAQPASWQADPSGRHAQRYWDGSRWTAHVMNGSQTAIDPI